MTKNFYLNFCILTGLMLGGLLSSPVRGQDDFFGVDDEDLESQEGLQSATPTDSVNELNVGGNNANGSFENNAGGETNFPAADDEGGFDLNAGENSGGEPGDNFFGNQPVNNGVAAPGVSAYGGGQAPAANGNPVQANPLQQASPQQAIPNQITNQQAPANAQSLMNQITTNPTNAAPANAIPETPVADPAAVISATGEETLLPSNPEPAIDAPPLPPPNEFAGSPPVPGTMRLLAESEAPEEYLVQPGDTLFDICDQLLDEPGYWPKLWALNPEIKNPHFIFPNMKLRFYPGDDETPPYLQVVTEEEVIPIEKGDLDEQELIAEKVVFDEETGGPDSINIEVIGIDEVEEISDLVLGGGRSFRSEEIRVQVPGFIYGDEKEPEGYIIGGRNGELSLGPGAKVVVESAGGISAGTLYTVLRPGEKIRDPDSNDFVGYKYYYVGNVRVQKSLESDLYMGIVESNRLSVRPDDIVVSFISTYRTVPIAGSIGSTSSFDAYLVGFEYYDQELGGQGNFAFISKGSGDGVSPGMYVPVYANPGYLTQYLGPSNLPEDQEFVGVMRIIDTTEAGAVGYIVKNVKEFRIGDRTGKG